MTLRLSPSAPISLPPPPPIPRPSTTPTPSRRYPAFWSPPWKGFNVKMCEWSAVQGPHALNSAIRGNFRPTQRTMGLFDCGIIGIIFFSSFFFFFLSSCGCLWLNKEQWGRRVVASDLWRNVYASDSRAFDVCVCTLGPLASQHSTVMSGGKRQREQFLVPPSTVNGYKKGRVESMPRTRSDTDFTERVHIVWSSSFSLPPPHPILCPTLSHSLSHSPPFSLSLSHSLSLSPPPLLFSLSVSLCAPLSPFFLCSTLDAKLKVPTVEIPELLLCFEAASRIQYCSTCFSCCQGLRLSNCLRSLFIQLLFVQMLFI